MNNIKIISGGQSGVDRAALDFALKFDIPVGGWCPNGRLAEDGIINKKYPLKETITSDYDERTQKNVEESDGTLIITINTSDKGTDFTRHICNELSKPIIEIDIGDNFESNKNKLTTWISKHKITILNIAGPRESSRPGIYKAAISF